MANILKQIRWQQRYLNYLNAYTNLSTEINKTKFSNLERAGIIQYFEVAFELAWKTIKDYLESEGIIVQTPREVLKQAFAIKIIENGEDWLECLDKRNLLTHTYNEELASFALSAIQKKYFELFKNLSQFFEQKIFSAKNFGFKLSEFLTLIQVFTKYPEIQEVNLFGSRAMGNFKKNSDVDLCLIGNITSVTLENLERELNEILNLPYKFDLVELTSINDPALVQHIKSARKVIYFSSES